MEQVAEHAKSAHRIDEITDEHIREARAAIKEVRASIYIECVNNVI